MSDAPEHVARGFSTPGNGSEKTPRPLPFTSSPFSSLATWKLFRSRRPLNEPCVSSAAPRLSLFAPTKGKATSTLAAAESDNHQELSTLLQVTTRQLSHHRFTFPRSSTPKQRHQSSLELPRELGSWSTRMATDDPLGLGLLGLDGNRWSSENFHRSFHEGNIHIDSREMVRSRDFVSMIDIHMLACRNDLFVSQLQGNKQPRTELDAMKNMLEERLKSAENNVLIARVELSSDPKYIAGWLSCSIIRHSTSSKSKADDQDLRTFDWNIATAMNMNLVQESTSETQQERPSFSFTHQRNVLIEILKTSCRRAQKGEFADEDFIVITNLAIHPNYPKTLDLGTQLVLEARMHAYKLGMPLYVFAPAKCGTLLYKDKCGFTEIGQHISWATKPESMWKHFIFKPGEYWTPSASEGKWRFENEQGAPGLL